MITETQIPIPQFVPPPAEIDPEAVHRHAHEAAWKAVDLRRQFDAITDPAEKRRFALAHKDDAKSHREFVGTCSARYAYLSNMIRKSGGRIVHPEHQQYRTLRDAVAGLEHAIASMIGDADCRPRALTLRLEKIRRAVKQLQDVSDVGGMVSNLIDTLELQYQRIDTALGSANYESMIALAAELGLEDPQPAPTADTTGPAPGDPEFVASPPPAAGTARRGRGFDFGDATARAGKLS